MTVAADSLDPQPEPHRPAHRTEVFALLQLPAAFLVYWLARHYTDIRGLFWLLVGLLPGWLIEIRYAFLRTYQPDRVPIPLFDAEPPLYERLVWWRHTCGALTLGMFIGGLAVILSEAPQKPVIALQVLSLIGYSAWMTLYQYIKVRNGLRTA